MARCTRVWIGRVRSTARCVSGSFFAVGLNARPGTVTVSSSCTDMTTMHEVGVTSIASRYCPAAIGSSSLGLGPDGSEPSDRLGGAPEHSRSLLGGYPDSLEGMKGDSTGSARGVETRLPDTE